LITNRHRPDQPIGPAADIAKTLAVALAVAVALALMPVAGFLASAAVIGVVVAAAFGERRILSGFVVTLAIAALVTAGARYGLKIPLP
ncbi:MAG: tripartite tricarboxylate transporter TctB family protein, partial [Burkholderiaceae bacterium]